MLPMLSPGSQEFNNYLDKSSFGALSECNVFCWIACALFKSKRAQMECPKPVEGVPKCCSQQEHSAVLILQSAPEQPALMHLVLFW